MVFQDPYASLNPRHSIGRIVGEPLRTHGLANRRQANARVRELLGIVGLPADAASRYPHEFSGGQRQRIGLARALALNPDFIVADEPVSALDVSIQAQIINLLENLQDEFDLTYLFIAHDLAVVRHISDRIAVMYLGTIVEISPADELYDNPLHPYTISLLSAVPIPDPEVETQRETILLAGDLPSPANPPPACRFHTRCPYVQQTRCKTDVPELRKLGDGHMSSRATGRRTSRRAGFSRKRSRRCSILASCDRSKAHLRTSRKGYRKPVTLVLGGEKPKARDKPRRYAVNCGRCRAQRDPVQIRKPLEAFRRGGGQARTGQRRGHSRSQLHSGSSSRSRPPARSRSFSSFPKASSTVRSAIASSCRRRR